MSALLSRLASAGIVERATVRGRASLLRVTPRFLGHAEREGARRRAVGLAAAPETVLEAALGTWDEYHDDPRRGAQLLFSVLAERDQLGLLRPTFPTLDAFAVAAS